MNFIETLRSIGGVKSCPNCETLRASLVEKYGVKPSANQSIIDGLSECSCHGTGQILDLAPLLAKPKELEDCAKYLVMKLPEVNEILQKALINPKKDAESWAGQTRPFENLSVVGPARCTTFGYEVARQLGGTAVVTKVLAEKKNCSVCGMPYAFNEDGLHSLCECPSGHAVDASVYSLSLPIPDGATVLFVTDKIDEKEIRQMVGCVKERKLLPYVLCLISQGNPELSVEVTEPWIVNGNNFSVISLHQEKP
jgi:hypothetical protein